MQDEAVEDPSCKVLLGCHESVVAVLNDGLRESTTTEIDTIVASISTGKALPKECGPLTTALLLSQPC